MRPSKPESQFPAGARKPGDGHRRPPPDHDAEAQRRMIALVQDLIKKAEGTHVISERRRSFRHPYPKAARMTPYDKKGDLQMIASKMVLIRDISRGGIGFLHTAEMPQKYLQLELDGPSGSRLCLLVEVRRVQPMSEEIYLYGCEFVERLSSGDENGRLARKDASTFRR